MSRAAQSTLALPEITVRNPAQRADTLHRIDEDADELRPACPEGDYREDVDWNDVPTSAYHPHYGLCRNPECFGRDWR